MNDLMVLRAMTMASAIDEILKDEDRAIVGTALSIVVGKLVSTFPDDKREEALDLLVTATAKYMALADAK